MSTRVWTATTDPLFPPWRSRKPENTAHIRHRPLLVPLSMVDKVNARVPRVEEHWKKLEADETVYADETSSEDEDETSDVTESDVEEVSAPKKGKDKELATSEDSEFDFLGSDESGDEDESTAPEPLDMPMAT